MSISGHIGTPVFFQEDDESPRALKSGEYGLYKGIWYACPPRTELLANLANHSVMQEADGTITVSPSILVDNGSSSWHGYLEKGVWREC